MSYGVGHRCGSDPTLLWLWCRPVAIALIGPLAWETLYAMRAAQEMAKRQEKKKKKTKDDAHRGWHRPACGSSLAHYLFW